MKSADISPVGLRVLFVEDDSNAVELMKTLFSRAGYVVEALRVCTGVDLKKALIDREWDIAVSDYNMPDFSGPEALEIIKQLKPDLPCIMVSGMVGEEVAVDLLRKGAADFVSKAMPVRLVPAVQRELKEAENRRQKKAIEARYEAVINNIDIGVAVIDPDFRVITSNTKMKEWYPGVDHDARPLCYQSYGNPVVDQPCSYCPTVKTLRDGQVHEAVTETPAGDEILHFRIVSSPLRDSEGKVTAAIEMVEDITSKVRDEKALRSSEILFRSLYDSSRDAIMTLEPPEWRFTAGNRATIEMFRTGDEAVFASTVPWHLSPSEQPDGTPSDIKARQMIEKAVKDGSSFFEWQHKRLDGELFPATVLLNRVNIGDRFFLQATVRDLTEQKRIERELTQAQKLESIGQLAAGIAHEINTPAQYIGDHTQFVRESFNDILPLFERCEDLLRAAHDGSITEELLSAVEAAAEEADLEYVKERVPKALDQALEGVERVSTIVKAMKDFAHPGKGEATPADLNRLVESTVTVARNEWKYVAELELDLDKCLPSVVCIPGEINQVILNMVVNAAHAIGESRSDGEMGLIRVSTAQEGDFAVIKISDNGAGIKESNHKNIFDPFFTTKEVGKGTGQGLAIAYNVVVKKHGGSITFDSNEGQGTTFNIKIPLEKICGEEPGTNDDSKLQ